MTKKKKFQRVAHLDAQIEVGQFDDKGLLIVSFPLVPRDELLGRFSVLAAVVIASFWRK